MDIKLQEIELISKKDGTIEPQGGVLCGMGTCSGIVCGMSCPVNGGSACGIACD